MIKRLGLGILSLLLGIGLVTDFDRVFSSQTILTGTENKTEKARITDSSGMEIEIPDTDIAKGTK